MCQWDGFRFAPATHYTGVIRLKHTTSKETRMGYSTMMFGVDLNRIKNAITDHDTSVVDVARDKDSDEFESTLDDGEPTVGEALTAIIKGEGIDKTYAHQYGYAFKLMCETLGEGLPDDDMIGDLDPLELQSPLEEFRTPIEIPANEDFPYIAFLTAEEVKQESTRLSSMDLSFPDDEDIEEAREAYANCINEAASKSMAVVTFYH